LHSFVQNFLAHLLVYNLQDMATQKEIIRNLLLYEYQLGHDAQTAAANVNRAKGPKTVHQATAFRWFAKFRDDNTSLIEHLRRELTNWFE